MEIFTSLKKSQDSGIELYNKMMTDLINNTNKNGDLTPKEASKLLRSALIGI